LSNIINSSDKEERNVNKYIFKSLATGSELPESQIFESALVGSCG